MSTSIDPKVFGGEDLPANIKAPEITGVPVVESAPVPHVSVGAPLQGTVLAEQAKQIQAEAREQVAPVTIRDLQGEGHTDAVLAVILLAAAFFLVKIFARYKVPAPTRPTESVEPESATNPVLAAKQSYLKLFLQTQEAMLRLGSERPVFHSEREKLRYFHFVLGAIDRLGQTIPDETLSELWWSAVPLAHSAIIWGADDAVRALESYGRTGDAELGQASTRGADAMNTYILRSSDKVSEADFRITCRELFCVVRGA